MNTLQILTKRVNYFEGMYPLDLLSSSLIKPSIIVINLDKHYMPGSHWVAVCFPTLGTPNILIRAGYHNSNLKSWHTCKATQFLGHLTGRLQGLSSNVCGHYCCFYALHSGLSITSFVNMFVSARYTCNVKRAIRMFRAVRIVPLAAGWSSSSRVSHKYK